MKTLILLVCSVSVVCPIFAQTIATTSAQGTPALPTYTSAGTGAVATTVNAKLGEQVSVKDFGAIGDDSHNDSPNIQAAITYACSINGGSSGGGGRVYFPAGTYYISSVGLTVPSGCKIQIWADRAAIDATVLPLNGTALTIASTGNHNSVSGLFFIGPGSSPAGTTAIKLTGGASQTQIDHCTFTAFSGIAISVITGDTQNLRITHNNFNSMTGTAIDIRTTTDNLDISGNSFQTGMTNAAAGIRIDNNVGAAAQNIRANQFITDGTAILLLDVSFVYITGNEFEQAVTNTGARSAFIDVQGGVGISARVHIDGNMLNAISHASYCIYMSDQIFDSTIINNNITGYNTFGIRVGAGANNVFANNRGASPGTIYSTAPPVATAQSYAGNISLNNVVINGTCTGCGSGSLTSLSQDGTTGQITGSKSISDPITRLSSDVDCPAAVCTLNAALGSSFVVTLKGSVTSAWTNLKDGQILKRAICQDATGGRAFVDPASFSGAAAVSLVANVCTKQTFLWNATSATAMALSNASIDDTPTIFTGPTRAAPATPTSGGSLWFDIFANTAKYLNPAGQMHIAPRTSQTGDQLALSDLVGYTGAYTCNAAVRGQINYIAGGAGVKDIVQVCTKNVSDVYAWFSIY